jgi:hypothetical protein
MRLHCGRLVLVLLSSQSGLLLGLVVVHIEEEGQHAEAVGHNRRGDHPKLAGVHSFVRHLSIAACLADRKLPLIG